MEGGSKSVYYVLLLILKIVATIFSLPVARDRNLFANCCLCALAHKAVSFNIKIVQSANYTDPKRFNACRLSSVHCVFISEMKLVLSACCAVRGFLTSC